MGILNPIVFAADYSSIKDANLILRKISSHIGMLKIGLELYTKYGNQALELGKIFNLPIFLDLKFHDIPNTVSKAVKNIADLSDYYDIKLLTVHSLGSSSMVEAAVHATANTNLKIAAVSILTCLDARDMAKLGMSKMIDLQAGLLSSLAKDAGARAFVCAASDIKSMRKLLGSDAELIVPGIRIGKSSDDQKRVASPLHALKKGADRLVIGRSISQAEDPVQVLIDLKKTFTNEMS